MTGRARQQRLYVVYVLKTLAVFVVALTGWVLVLVVASAACDGIVKQMPGVAR